jgi:hypothetical protein
MRKWEARPAAWVVACLDTLSLQKALAAFFAAMLAMSAILGGAACGSGEDEPAPMFSPGLAAPEIIDRCAEAMETVDSYHLVLSHSGGGTPAALGLEVTRIACDVTRPDRLAGDIEAMLMGSYVDLDLVTVGSLSYLTNPLTGKWEQVSTKFDAAGMFDPDTSHGAMLRAMADPTRINDEKVTGLDCFHIEGEMASGDLFPIVLLLRLTPIEGAVVDAEMWVDHEEFLLRRIRFEGQVTADENPGITRTMTLTKYGQEVQIELPE